MTIIDYSNHQELSDVAIYLSREEAAELSAYLNRLLDTPDIHKVYLSQIVRNKLEKELTVALHAA